MSDPQDVGPEPVPVTAAQLAAGRDAVPAQPEHEQPEHEQPEHEQPEHEQPEDELSEDEERREAAESHDDAGPEQEQPE